MWVATQDLPRSAAHPFYAISLWESEEAVRRFAGDDIALARYYPEDDDFLLERPRHVTHAEVVACELSLPLKAS